MLKRMRGNRSLRAFARDLGVSASHLCGVWHGKYVPGPAVLEPLGYERIRTVTRTIRKKRSE